MLTRLLADRAAAPAFYARADYRPAPAEGALGARILAYRRRDGDEEMLVAVPRLVAGLIDGEQPPLGAPFWRDTAVPAPSGPWRDVLTGARRDGVGGRLAASDLFAALPIAVLRTIS